MSTLLPASSEPFEFAIEESHAARWNSLGAAVPYITTSKENPPQSYLPFLVYEFGLGMLTPYVANLYDLLDGRGVQWLRVRGTYEAIERGLAFLGVSATMEPAWHGRVWWNSAQLRFDALPSNDSPLLGRVEGITRLSLPFRSDLRRGVFEYDIPPVEADGTLLDGSLIEEESGIRLIADGTIWSFGRTAEFDHTLSQAEGEAIGNWIDFPPAGSGFGFLITLTDEDSEDDILVLTGEDDVDSILTGAW